IGLAPRRRVIVVVLIVEASIASLNVARTFSLTDTPVAASAGAVELTVGGVVSAGVPVVKVHTTSLGSALPARSRAPVVILAVYVVLGARFAEGAKVAVLPA